MRRGLAGYGFFSNAIHWVIAGISVVLLGLGWSLHYSQPAEPTRDFLFELHTSLALAGTLLIVAQSLLHSAFAPSVFTPWEAPSAARKWRRLLIYTLYQLVYVSFVIMAVSGYFQAVFSAAPLQFFGVSLSPWGAADHQLAEFFGAAHQISAVVLAGSIFAHLALLAASWIKPPSVESNRLAVRAENTPAHAGKGTTPPIAPTPPQRLAQKFRFFGWLAFWPQFLLALLSAPLLVFGFAGRAVSPEAGGFGDAIYLGLGGLALLLVAIVLDFYYTIAAKKIAKTPEYYLTTHNSAAFWFLGAGAVVGVAGLLTAFIGVGFSVSLLIAKTVSQPPGIAITDPSKIIRALDVFILLVNFSLLFAHFIGAGVAAWLSNSTLKAHSIHHVMTDKPGAA
jgi:cytochrome b561